MLLQQRLLHFFTVIFCLIALPAAAQLQIEECKPVARLFNEIICHNEVMVEQEHISAIKKEFEEQGLDSDEALQARSLQRLKDIIWDKALARKFDSVSLAATKEEIDFYSKTLKDSLAKSHQENIKAARKVKELLETGGYSEQEELKLRSLLSNLETSIAFYKERESYNKDMPPEFHQMVVEAEREIAENVIREGRVNKALYHEYGGKIVLDQGAPVPVDAYDKFVDYIRKEGGLVILDGDFKNVFTQTENYITQLQKLPAAKGEVFQESFFSSPLWNGNSGASQN